MLVHQPDLMFEAKDDKLGGVTGFGSEYQCVDWKQFRDRTAEREIYQQLYSHEEVMG